MKMEQRIGNAAVDVEKFSKLGTQDLQNSQPQRALESFKYAYKRSRELDDSYTERACAFNLGAVYIALGQFRRGIDTLEKSIPPENKREGRSNGDLYFNFGLGYEGLGNNEEAVRNYNKALEEYKVERDNVRMEAECLEKLAQLYIKMRNRFAADTFSQLAAAYEILDNPVKQMWALSEKANQQFTQGQLEDAESTADECLKLSSKCDTNANIGNIYNDLGLIYTQMTKYDKAVTCFEQALPLIRNIGGGDRKQEAVVLQNLGATYNFLSEYEKAVKYHEEAADLYALLKNRNSQGQCFANLAFAQSQLGNINEAGEAFLHAFQAAKDTGDKRTQWQVCEGLGAVAFSQKDFPKAIGYFKKALGFLAAVDSSNSMAQDRIVAKLTKALEIQAMGAVQNRVEVQRQEYEVKLSKKPSKKPSKEIVTRAVKEEAIIEQSVPVGRSPGEYPRFVPVARHGSMRRFQKVARGFSSTTGSSLGYHELEKIDSGSETSSTGSSESEVEDAEKEKDQTQGFSTRTNQGRPFSARPDSSRRSLVRTIGEGLENQSQTSSSEESDTEKSPAKGGNSDDDEKQAVKEAMKKNLETQSSSDEGEDDEKKHEEASEKIRQQSDSGSSDSSSESDSPPAPPTRSPPLTAKPMVGTYETPAGVKQKLHYGEIDFEAKKKSEKGERKNPNFLNEDEISLPSSDDSTLDEAVKALKGKEFAFKEAHRGNDTLAASGTYHNDEIEENIVKATPDQPHDEDDPVYQSIRSRASTLRNQDDEVDTPSFEKPAEFKSFSKLPRGMQSSHHEEEAARFEEHRRLVREKEEREMQTDQKESKTCVVM